MWLKFYRAMITNILLAVINLPLTLSLDDVLDLPTTNVTTPES